MGRPEFPTGCVLPSSCIRRIREDQDYYDRDPERAERQQTQTEEQRRMDDEQLREEYNRQQ